MASEAFNIAQFLPEMARLSPRRAAIVCEHRPDALGRTQLSFAELDAESDALAGGLAQSGLAAGQRVLLMVRPGLDLISLTFALFKLGTVPVLIDPGMGKTNLLDCIRQSRPHAMIAIPLAHALRTLAGGGAFGTIKLHVTVGRRWFWGGQSLAQIRALGERYGPPPMAPTTRETPAAVLFTSGSTGIPKGVLYTHGMFGAQVEIIREQFGIRPGDVDLPAFPLFALFSTALGSTCVVPEMDPTRPAQCDPAKIVGALRKHKVTYSFGSPSIWKRVGPYCVKQGIRLPHLKRILMAGAPVRGEVLASFASILEADGDTFIPYGATESLPVSWIRGSEVLKETWGLTRRGKGHCVGRPVPNLQVRVVTPERFPTAECGALGTCELWDPARILPAGQMGEIVVSGPVVTREYYEMPAQTRAAKLYEFSGDRASNPSVVWHRMGDMGYFDATGRLWFCGRKAHRVLLPDGTVLYSVCVEAVFEEALRNFRGRPATELSVRAALVGVGEPERRRAFIVFESQPQNIEELERWRPTDPMGRWIAGVLWHPRPFPVDVRHNAKINREQLAQWAGMQDAAR